jgi:two-component system LytT family sensor kinase
MSPGQRYDLSSKAAEEMADDVVALRELEVRIVPKVLFAYWFALLWLYLAREIDVSWTSRFASLGRRVPEVLLGMALCWLMTLVLRRAQPRATFPRLLWLIGLSLPLGALFSVANGLAFSIEHGWAFQPSRQLTIDYSVNFAIVFLAWGALYLGMRATTQVVVAERDAGAARDAARLAELRALRYQVDPHFLFNCLNSLGTLVDKGDTAAAKGMIGEMSSFLRYGLAIDALADVDLSDEIEMQRRYLEIERLRFSHRLAVIINVDPLLRNARIPSLLLQPLVENAVKHGVATTSAPVSILIRAVPSARGMVIAIEDDAPNANPNKGTRLGIGLSNVRDRLRARFGDAASLTVQILASGGFRAEIAMPLVRG